jgi:hypothetical protein
MRPRPHLQALRNPRQRHRRLRPQPPRNPSLARTTLPTPAMGPHPSNSAGQFPPAPSALVSVAHSCARDSGVLRRELAGKYRPFTELAGHLDHTPKSLDQGFDDREPQPGAARAPGPRPVHPMEPLKQPWQVQRRDALALVGDAEDDLAFRAHDLDLDGLSGRGMSKAIADQIAQDLFHRQRIRRPWQCFGRCKRECHLLLIRQPKETRVHRAGNGGGVTGNWPQQFLPCISGGEGQQIIGKA